MTRKIFWDDPYLRQLNTRINSVIGDEVTVDATIFYAFSGGQESDHGTFNDFPVIEARKSGEDIFYTLPAQHGLQKDDEVFMQIEWSRRYRLMRLHFAAEVVLELVYQFHHGIEKIGAHIAEDKARLDFAWPQNISAIFPQLQDQLEQLVAADRPILSRFSDEAMQRRYWEVEGFARVPCGGTHLKSTAEIGQVALKRKNIGSQKERIEIRLQ